MKFSSLLFLPLILLLQFTITIHAKKPQNLINSTCKTFAQQDPNINYNFCTTSLQSAPTAKRANLHKLGSISIKLIRQNATDTRRFIKQLIRNNRKSKLPYLNRCLIDCFELYSDAIPTIKQAMRNYGAKRFDDANFEISSVMDDATTCEDGFSERIGVDSPLTKRNGDLFQLSAMALSFVCLIQRGNG